MDCTRFRGTNDQMQGFHRWFSFFSRVFKFMLVPVKQNFQNKTRHLLSQWCVLKHYFYSISRASFYTSVNWTHPRRRKRYESTCRKPVGTVPEIFILSIMSPHIIQWFDFLLFCIQKFSTFPVTTECRKLTRLIVVFLPGFRFQTIIG